MSISIRFSDNGSADGDVFQVASASGWAALSKWVSDLPDAGEDFDDLKKLVDTGELLDDTQLSKELERALEINDPPTPVRTTIEGLLRLVGTGSPQETVTIEI